jgi:hypothetical protein
MDEVDRDLKDHLEDDLRPITREITKEYKRIKKYSRLIIVSLFFMRGGKTTWLRKQPLSHQLLLKWVELPTTSQNFVSLVAVTSGNQPLLMRWQIKRNWPKTSSTPGKDSSP